MALEGHSQGRATDTGGARGLLAVVAAFVMWGVLPVYWKALANVSALEIIAHRIVWSLALTALLVTAGRRWGEVSRVFRSGRLAGLLLLSATLLSANWLTFIWGVNHGRVLETSLGYFVTPLLSVGLGVVFLRERMTRAQALAIVLAGAGVTNLLARRAPVPWIALALAVTFSVYGLIRKTTALDSLPGLTAETALLSVPAALFLGARAHAGAGALGHASPLTHVLLAGTGLVTAIPLLLFAYGARRIRLITVGLSQYLSPTGTFFLGALVYRESLPRTKLVSFVLIWAALVLYATDGLLRARIERGDRNAVR